jgi:hypothetical protein
MPTTGSSSSEPPRRWDKPRAFAQRERIDAETLRQWQEKGVVEVRRIAPRTGVRVRYREEEDG